MLQRFLKGLRSIPLPRGKLSPGEIVSFRKGYQRGYSEAYAAGLLEGVELGFDRGSKEAVIKLVQELSQGD